MPDPAPALDQVTISGGFLLVLAVVVPVIGILLAFATGGRQTERIALVTMPLGLVIAAAILVALRRADAPLVYLLGGWAPPLGLALRADGLSAVMMAITAIVIGAVGVFAHRDFATPPGSVEARAPFAFWILLLAVWGALNTVFVGGDLFTLYVALELLTFAAVPLVYLDGSAETLQAALRYLIFALLGSVLYLTGTVLLYGGYGTLDIVLLSGRAVANPATLVAAALMTVGLLAKTALFPLHLWLPPAHAGGRQRGAVGAGREGILLHYRPALVRCDAGTAGLRGRAAARCAGRRSDRGRQRRRVAAAAIEALDRLLDFGADRVPLPDVSACAPCRLDAARKRRCIGRRRAPGDVSRYRESRHVHVGRIDLCSARPRPHHRAGRNCAGAAGECPRFRASRGGAARDAAERRLLGKGAAAASSSRDAAVVVGGSDSSRRDLHCRLRITGARACACTRGRTGDVAVSRVTHSGRCSAGARAVLAAARNLSLAVLSSRCAWWHWGDSVGPRRAGINPLAGPRWRSAGSAGRTLGRPDRPHLLRTNRRRDDRAGTHRSARPGRDARARR